MGKTAKPDIYESVTASIMEAIEEGAGTFEMPWNNAPMLPVNVASGKSYNGINTLILMLVAAQKGYGSGIWGTYKQWQAKGAQVIKGAKSTPAVFYKEFTCENEEGIEQPKPARHAPRLFLAFLILA
ncbi:MAG: ArdC family protein, partial [Pseudomonadota bacterium]